jgi:hypothetical protein
LEACDGEIIHHEGIYGLFENKEEILANSHHFVFVIA